MRLTISTRAQVGYLKLRRDDESIRVAENVVVKPPGATDADNSIILDFDGEGHLVGIEFLVPGRQLLPSLLGEAETYD